MTLETYIHEVLSSGAEDWTLFSLGGGDAGLFFQGDFMGQGGTDDQMNGLRCHTNGASFKKNLAIGLAWGLESNDDFRETWANKFPDPRASSHLVDFFFNNTLVLREIFVMVDGGRCYLPLPDRSADSDSLKIEKLVVPQAKADLFRLINALNSADGFEATDEFDVYMRRAGINIVGSPWPE